MRLLIALPLSVVIFLTACSRSNTPKSEIHPAVSGDKLDEFGRINGEIPIGITVNPGESVEIFGETLSMEKAHQRLLGFGNLNPAQPVLIVADDTIPPERVQQIIDMCKNSHLPHVVRIQKFPVMPPPLPSQGQTAGP